MKVLVTGAGGMLARDIIPCLSEQGYEILAVPHSELDIADFGAIEATTGSFEPELIINCAAYTKVDEAEKAEHWALLVNGIGVQNLCIACQESDIALVHFSTDYVFDGSKESPYTIYDNTSPINAYGRSKLLGEKYILWLLGKFYIVRSSWLFGLHGRNFVETMLEIGQREQQVSVVNDQRGCPTWTYHLAKAVVDLIDTGRYGVYHVTNSDSATWFDFSKEVFRLSGMDIEVLPIISEQFPRPAKRPRNSVLDPFPLPQIFGCEMPSWREALGEYLSQRREKVKS